ncbi:MAG TPA: hypothetical protein VFZ53_29180 [Polyangiaceae bacterium]
MKSLLWGLLGVAAAAPAVGFFGGKTPALAAHAGPAAPSAAVATPCGASPLPDCPLQGWMKSNLTPALEARDAVRLERSLRRLAELGPAEYDDWRRLSLDAADAAHDGDLAVVRGACKECHSRHRGSYRRAHRNAPLR